MSTTAGQPTAERPEDRARNGVVSAFFAYLLWGLLPIYLYLIPTVSSLEILAHRVVWAIPFGALIIFARRQWPEVRQVFADRRVVGFLAVTSLLIAANWFIYVFAVQANQVYQASLGYYINPLLNVMVGVLLFDERLRRLQLAAVALAAVGVAVLAIRGESFPWIALALGTSFTIYGAIRKQVRVGAMPGLFVETGFLLPVAAFYLVWTMVQQRAAFGAGDTALDLTLLLAGPFTVMPLLLFALAAKRLQLTTIGIMQFMSPTLQFFVGVYYGEELSRAHIVCFAFIWTAISVFAWDAWRESRRIQALRAAGTT